MPNEIERKFLVKHQLWNELKKHQGSWYRQGYLVVEPKQVIRVRQVPAKGFITIKGSAVGIIRAEYEYEIPFDEAGELIDQFAHSIISKTRYKINEHGKLWEIDVFDGDNEGLIIAEIELVSEHESFVKPEWLADEVTKEEKYYNYMLAANPFNSWK